VCLSDDWKGNAEPPNWRDTHFRVEGPVVGQIQAAFVDNWLQSKSEILEGEDFFPPLEKQGSMVAQCFKSGPNGGADAARINYLMSFAAARKTIRVSHAYFVPDDVIIQELREARKRGVRVEILFPRKIDNVAVRKAGWARLGKLLEAGVKFYEYQPTLYHCKIVIVDDVWSIVGSVNFDERSLRINDEATLNVLDKKFAAQLIETFEKDKSQSRPLELKDFKKRNFIARFFDHFAGLFAKQL
jgi:cardiolipin synthase A/B